MSWQSSLENQRNGLCLLGLGKSLPSRDKHPTHLGKDAGGTRGISQLKILTELMDRLNLNVKEDHQLRPCDAFNLIGGAGSGG
jgi:hypothetical protein